MGVYSDKDLFPLNLAAGISSHLAKRHVKRFAEKVWNPHVIGHETRKKKKKAKKRAKVHASVTCRKKRPGPRPERLPRPSHHVTHTPPRPLNGIFPRTGKNDGPLPEQEAKVHSGSTAAGETGVAPSGKRRPSAPGRLDPGPENGKKKQKQEKEKKRATWNERPCPTTTGTVQRPAQKHPQDPHRPVPERRGPLTFPFWDTPVPDSDRNSGGGGGCSPAAGVAETFQPTATVGGGRRWGTVYKCNMFKHLPLAIPLSLSLFLYTQEK
ncbi:uncharacterized protein KNAG_0B01590 [Huiozyma naganishii CBS 8797]|uniref:Uncharacterized protein n=1 Tax=Huiozyma naganishii (strain ATCC MYA-139 / BCRC 22969 / CBS 8797 / KCTC 17520 / NBRC 10181 / NCYC 3082 / Yp74L-3) TaxID=1071383 RepID=J7S4J2_HUIN7|nr:hypothetical protein KNAG_0B01590 [Kazachstania naganishii CBS 8797]CCK68606.1 hypothetical protein KNAG_0B01590 [Kazachstania naganishii CBS 8797]